MDGRKGQVHYVLCNLLTRAETHVNTIWQQVLDIRFIIYFIMYIIYYSDYNMLILYMYVNQINTFHNLKQNMFVKKKHVPSKVIPGHRVKVEVRRWSTLKSSEIAWPAQYIYQMWTLYLVQIKENLSARLKFTDRQMEG